MDKMKTYSVNLTAEEWSFIIGELHQRKQNEVEDGYIQAKITAREDPDEPDYIPTEADKKQLVLLQNMMNMYDSINKKVAKKEKSDNKEIKKLKERNTLLTQQIDKQHTELATIKKKISELL
tara:strand:- start:4 stop:369 length:366 start_codon:yes stop_codon:yes gene_type:complete